MVIKTCSNLGDDKRVFLSTIKDDNPLDCLLEKIKIVQLLLNVDLDTKLVALSDADYYYDMIYNVPFSSFLNSQHDNVRDGNKSYSTISSETNDPQDEEEDKRVKEMKLLDLYSGCGAMSTGLCLGANMSGVHLVTIFIGLCYALISFIVYPLVLFLFKHNWFISLLIDS